MGFIHASFSWRGVDGRGPDIENLRKKKKKRVGGRVEEVRVGDGGERERSASQCGYFAG